ncbi:MAG: hypothetical protein K0R14_1234 [Burkholderiales bacterium]|jgi:hypothetical protein|nr:hypothetical protein [Burkholderiales bacterium]
MNKLLQKNSLSLILFLLLCIAALSGCITGGASGAGGNGNINADLVTQMYNNLPPLGNDMCGFGVESTPITSNDCIINDQIFYDGVDSSIAFILKNDGNWSDTDIAQLLSYPTVEERYFYFITHNQGPLNLQCNKGLEPTEPNCKPALFGNSEFVIDYLLCPNLANKFLILDSDHWSLHLNEIFIYCAANKMLKNQCQSQATTLIATPQSLIENGRYTFTSRETCLLVDQYRLNLHPTQSKARYNIFYIY